MDPLRLRIARVVSRIVRWAMVEGDSADGDPYQTQRLTYLGKSGDSVSWYPYGFNANAPGGSLALMLAVAGDSSSTVHIPGSPRERPKVKVGEVVLYHPKTGAKVLMKEDGGILIESAGTVDVIADKVHMQVATEARITGPSRLDGFCTMNNVNIQGTLLVQGNADFQAALTVDPTGNPSGTNIDLREHVHLSDFTTGPGDVDGPKDP